MLDIDVALKQVVPVSYYTYIVGKYKIHLNVKQDRNTRPESRVSTYCLRS
jgi:hypothetical protein